MTYCNVLEYLAELKKQMISFEGIQNSTDDINQVFFDELSCSCFSRCHSIFICDEAPLTYGYYQDDQFFTTSGFNSYTSDEYFLNSCTNSIFCEGDKSLILATSSHSSWNKAFILQDSF